MPPRETVTIIPGDSDIPFDADQEAAFDEFRAKTRSANQQGTLRVYRIPLDERGQMLPNAKGQAELFAVPIDLYSYEEIINKIRREFIRPGQSMIAVRLLGTRAGVQGVAFNQVIMVERPNDPAPESLAKDSLADVLRVVQESGQRQQEFMERFFQKLVDSRNAVPVENPMNIAKGLLEAMGGFMAGIHANNPQIQATPAALSMKEMIESLIALRQLAGDLVGGDGGGDDDNTAVGIAKAVAPILQPIANALADKSRANTAVEMRRALPSPRPGPRANPAPSNPHNPSAEPQPVPAQAGDEAMLNIVKPQLDQLCDFAAQHAQSGSPTPEEVAGLVLDLVPDHLDDALWKFISSPRFVSNLGLINPRVKEFSEFFEKLRQAIMAEFSEPEPSQNT